MKPSKLLADFALPVACLLVLVGARAGMGAGASAGTTGDTTDNNAVAMQNSDSFPQVVAANNKTGFNIFAQSVKHSPSANVVVSPISIALCLDMVAAGAAGQTKEEMLKALNIKDDNLDKLNKENASLMSALNPAGSKMVLATANALWGNKEVTFNDPYIQTCRKYYQASVASLDFSSPKAADSINSWVSTNTHGKIPSIVDHIQPQELLILTNATYFKGLWDRPFEKEETQDGPFNLIGNKTKTMPMMAESGFFTYLQTDKFQAIELPYKEHEASLFILLPAKGTDISEFAEGLTNESWESTLNQFEGKHGVIILPRFKVTYSTELKDALATLGMGIAFDMSKADFKNISKDRLFIGSVIHKTLVEVDEKGTEAAAATAVHMVGAAMPSPHNLPFRMVVDRPFVMVIRENKTGSVLFVGAITDPELKTP